MLPRHICRRIGLRAPLLPLKAFNATHFFVPARDPHLEQGTHATDSSCIVGTLACLVGFGTFQSWSGRRSDVQCDEVQKTEQGEYTRFFTRAEVALHNSRNHDSKDAKSQKPVYVTYRSDVYDISPLVMDGCAQHPGGKFILTGAGGAVDDYFDYWAQHKSSWERVQDMLDACWVGKLKEDNDSSDSNSSSGNDSSGSKSNLSVATTVGVGKVTIKTDSRSSPCDFPRYETSYESDPWSDRKDLITFGCIPGNCGKAREWSPPFCGEPAQMQDLVAVNDFFTPNSHFYVRNHAPAPKKNKSSSSTEKATTNDPMLIPIPDLNLKFEIFIENANADSSGVSVQMLHREEIHLKDATNNKERPQVLVHHLPVTLQCTGNRCDELAIDGEEDVVIDGEVHRMNRAGRGNNIGTSLFTGLKLVDVLQCFGLKETLLSECSNSEHSEEAILEFHGADGFFIGIPLRLALDENRSVMLAFGMNGEVLSVDHGFPLRVVVPGLCGARSVKWLQSMRVKLKSSSSKLRFSFGSIKRSQRNQSNQSEYEKNDIDFETKKKVLCDEFQIGARLFPSPWHEQFYTRAGRPLYAWPICSFITSVESESDLEKHSFSLNGYASNTPSLLVHGLAYVGQDVDLVGVNADFTRVAKVEISVDEGKNWVEAQLVPSDYGNQWSWQKWFGRVKISEKDLKSSTTSVHVLSRATDSRGKTQPHFETVLETNTKHNDFFFNNAIWRTAVKL